MSGDQLMHSGYLRNLSTLAVGLGIDQVLSHTLLPLHHREWEEGELF